ncbi:unnamed protein product [Vitrella brassicaformis CCMP3155]|uniref:J domain-containing protein n=1 Tax=Vitrella brassicaformis (strain CCMP3155) TaxID=1169540 RepID=A0A0G4G1H7_VITBC|nr:unnamed protein product [Vitrella brassicaformis CCMP3155]|eukprot:CEM21721.1 unnamed protein product [Vitrella brassicaformis CCMP3155]
MRLLQEAEGASVGPLHEIKKSYHKGALNSHTDKGGRKEDFQALVEAYTVIKKDLEQLRDGDPSDPMKAADAEREKELKLIEQELEEIQHRRLLRERRQHIQTNKSDSATTDASPRSAQRSSSPNTSPSTRHTQHSPDSDQDETDETTIRLPVGFEGAVHLVADQGEAAQGMWEGREGGQDRGGWEREKRVLGLAQGVALPQAKVFFHDALEGLGKFLSGAASASTASSPTRRHIMEGSAQQTDPFRSQENEVMLLGYAMMPIIRRLFQKDRTGPTGRPYRSPAAQAALDIHMRVVGTDRGAQPLTHRQMLAVLLGQ